jgi:cyclophilin family peptidyl-prolyl cis-trans isomerase
MAVTATAGWGPPAAAQTTAERRLAIVLAESRGATTSKDLSTITAGLRGDPETTRIAVRALGRLERPALLSQIVPLLRLAPPEVRTEAANAVAQAAQGFKQPKVPSSMTLPATQAALLARLDVEDEPSVRAALCEAAARLPYGSAADVERVERAILTAAARNHSVTDRVGVAKALEALIRLHVSLRPASEAVIDQLRTFVFSSGTDTDIDALRDARVRRLALEGLVAAGAIDDALISRALKDPDAQVRRLAVRAAVATGHGTGTVDVALLDPVAAVRVEALQVVLARPTEAACTTALSAAADSTEVAVVALDRLGACRSESSIALLERTVSDPSRTTGPRGWPRAGRALVSLAAAAPERAAAALPTFIKERQWQLRMYGARAAAILKDRATLEALAADPVPAVSAEAAIGLHGRPATSARPHGDASPTDLQSIPIDSRRMAGLRARVTVQGLGRFDLALITAEAPATALRFAQHASAGLYSGRTFRVGSNTTLVGSALDAASVPGIVQRPEPGSWPNVRGTLAVSTDGAEMGDALFFVNLVDNPRFDHEHTVFAQVLTGIDVVDQIVEGDVIESVEILP